MLDKDMVGVGIIGRLKKVGILLFRKEVVLLPTLAILLYILVSFIITLTKKSSGFFQHLSSRSWQLSFYGAGIAKQIIHTFGPIATFLTIFLLILYVKKVRQSKMMGFLVFWIAIYLVPFLFLIEKTELPHMLFIVSPAFLLIASILVYMYERNLIYKFISTTCVICVLIGFGIVTLGSIFHIDPLNVGSFPKFNGAVGRGDPNRGFKAAGYYIREFAGPESKVFVPGEVYEISFVSEFYLGKQILPGRFNEKNLYLTRHELKNDSADYYLMPENINILDSQKLKVRQDIVRYINKQRVTRVAEIRDGKETLLTIYSSKRAPFNILDVKVFDEKFNKKYANIKNLATSFYQGGFER